MAEGVAKDEFMRCYTKAECEQWLRDRSRKLPRSTEEFTPHREGMKDVRAFAFAHWFAKNQTYEGGVLLWITEWGIWTSSENYHLFYKLRQMYGETRLLNEAPGLYFLAYEMDDLATMLQVAILNGWGGYILTEANYANAFFSHDEYIDFYGQFGEVKDWFAPA